MDSPARPCLLPQRKWHQIEVEDDVTAYLEFPNGATGVFVTTTADAPGTNRFEITLERGKLVAEHDKLTFFELEQSERDFCFTATGGFEQPAGHESQSNWTAKIRSMSAY